MFMCFTANQSSTVFNMNMFETATFKIICSCLRCLTHIMKFKLVILVKIVHKNLSLSHNVK